MPSAAHANRRRAASSRIVRVTIRALLQSVSGSVTTIFSCCFGSGDANVDVDAASTFCCCCCCSAGAIWRAGPEARKPKPWRPFIGVWGSGTCLSSFSVYEYSMSVCLFFWMVLVVLLLYSKVF